MSSFPFLSTSILLYFVVFYYRDLKQSRNVQRNILSLPSVPPGRGMMPVTFSMRYVPADVLALMMHLHTVHLEVEVKFFVFNFSNKFALVCTLTHFITFFNSLPLLLILFSPYFLVFSFLILKLCLCF